MYVIRAVLHVIWAENTKFGQKVMNLGRKWWIWAEMMNLSSYFKFLRSSVSVVKTCIRPWFNGSLLKLILQSFTNLLLFVFWSMCFKKKIYVIAVLTKMNYDKNFQCFKITSIIQFHTNIILSHRRIINSSHLGRN